MLLRQNVNDRAIRRDGNDALAIGLIGRIHQSDWPYYGYGDYYGSGDFYTADVPWCYQRFRCRE
jgi:hypothetical protein